MDAINDAVEQLGLAYPGYRFEWGQSSWTGKYHLLCSNGILENIEVIDAATIVSASRDELRELFVDAGTGLVSQHERR